MFTLYGFGFDYHLEPKKITEGVECFFGLHGKAEEINGGRVINTCFIESKEGYIVIDSGPTYSYAQQAYNVMQKRKPLPIKYVINTSTEELHILGNEFYKEQGATLIGPKAYASLVEEKQSLSLLEKVTDKIFMNTRLIPLDIYQNSDRTIIIDDTHLEIKKFEENDAQNLVVYLPKQETIFVGNYVSNNRVPALAQHHSLAEWMGTLKKIETMPWKHIVSAHGVKRSRKALTHTQTYLTQLKDKVSNELKQHHNREAATKNIELPPYSTIAFYDEFHMKNIQKAYDELKLIEPSLSIDKSEQVIQLAMTQNQKDKVVKEPSKVVKKTPKPEEVVESKKPVKTEPTPKVIAKKVVTNPLPKEKLTTVKKRIPNIKYTNFDRAKQEAIQEHKYLLIKVEANNCKPCDKLNAVLATNEHIKSMINKHVKAVKINTDYDSVPLGLTNMGTPTVFLIKPEEDRVLMKLEGNIDAEELEESLQLFVNDGYKTGMASL